MGFGDVRLAGVIGLTVGYLGLVHAYLAFLLGFVIGLVFGLVLMAAPRPGRKTRIPFAPALCVGAVVAILWGEPLVRHLFHAGSAGPAGDRGRASAGAAPGDAGHREAGRAARVDLTGCCAT